jgi:hypothetical protein
LANSNEEGKTYIGPSLEPCAPPVRAPMMGARVCAHATHVAGAAATIRGVLVRAPWPCAPPERAPALPCAPPCPCPPLGRARLFLRARPRGRACPSLPCAPHVRVFLTRPRPYRVRLPSISPTNLLFIPPLGHAGL